MLIETTRGPLQFSQILIFKLWNSVTKNYFENLVQALENGLSDVDSQAATSKAGGLKSQASGKGRGGSKSRSSTTTSRSSSSRNIDDSGHWSCEYCTYANPRSATACEMCHQHR